MIGRMKREIFATNTKPDTKKVKNRNIFVNSSKMLNISLKI
jgi:hypothetical protein